MLFRLFLYLTLNFLPSYSRLRSWGRSKNASFLVYALEACVAWILSISRFAFRVEFEAEYCRRAERKVLNGVWVLENFVFEDLGNYCSMAIGTMDSLGDLKIQWVYTPRGFITLLSVNCFTNQRYPWHSPWGVDCTWGCTRCKEIADSPDTHVFLHRLTWSSLPLYFGKADTGLLVTVHADSVAFFHVHIVNGRGPRRNPFASLRFPFYLRYRTMASTSQRSGLWHGYVTRHLGENPISSGTNWWISRVWRPCTDRGLRRGGVPREGGLTLGVVDLRYWTRPMLPRCQPCMYQLENALRIVVVDGENIFSPLRLMPGRSFVGQYLVRIFCGGLVLFLIL